MVTISPKRVRPTKRFPRRTTVWQLRVFLYFLSVLTLLFSVLMVVMAPSKNKSDSTVFEQQIPQDRLNLVNRDLESVRQRHEKHWAQQKPEANPDGSRRDVPPEVTIDRVPGEEIKDTVASDEKSKLTLHPKQISNDQQNTEEYLQEIQRHNPEQLAEAESKNQEHSSMEEQIAVKESNSNQQQQKLGKPGPPSNSKAIDLNNMTFEERNVEEVVKLIDSSDKVGSANKSAKLPETVSDSSMVNGKDRANGASNQNIADQKSNPRQGALEEKIHSVLRIDNTTTKEGEVKIASNEAPEQQQPNKQKPPKNEQDIVREKLDPPPTMFIVVADGRSGSDWIMNSVDQHPSVCASGEAGATSGSMGFPSGVLIPDGMPWLADSDLRQGCILAFVKKHTMELLHDSARCNTTYDAMKDPLQVHLPRLCRFVEKLQSNESLDKTNKAQCEAMITRLYMDAFASDDDILVPCRCPESTKIRGIKVMADWEERISGFLDHEENIKVIRLRRKNLFSRYMSLKNAMATNIWQTPSVEEKQRQLDALPTDYTIDLDDMMAQLHFLTQDDLRADAWALHHVRKDENLLNIEYEDCRDNAIVCFQQIFRFLGIDDGKTFVESHIGTFSTPFAEASVSKVSSVLDKISNADFVCEALGAGGYGSFVGIPDYREIQHLHLISADDAKEMIIRTPPHESAVNTTNLIVDYQGSTKHKFEAVCSTLEKMPESTNVVISLNTRESTVSINPHIRSHTMLYSAVSNLRNAIKTMDGKILVSSTDICCQAALSHALPGDFFEIDPNDAGRLKRKRRACLSGGSDCGWKGDKFGIPWRSKLMEEAKRHAPESHAGFNFIDASLIAGKASDLRVFFEMIDVSSSEDERAVLTDYFLLRPDSFYLDYGQKFFGQYFPGVQHLKRKGCFIADEKKPFKAMQGDGAIPLFVHTGSELGCFFDDDKFSSVDKFPKWNERGIPIESVTNHIDRVLVQNTSIPGIDRHFEPEILYVVDQSGLWASTVQREKYRIVPTEKFLVRTFEILRTEKGNRRWSNLGKVVSDSGFPYWGWYGDFKGCNDHNYGDESIPLFTTCALATCAKALPSPAYMTVIESKLETQGWFWYFQRYDRDYPWESKIRKAVWRGTLSENNPDLVLSSERYRLCELVAQRPESDSDIFDVGFTDIPDFVLAHTKLDVNDLGGLKAGISPMPEFQKYVAILDLDGSSWSSRFGSLLCYNSVIIKVEPAFVDYFFYELIPWKHYIPVKGDFSDLVENVAFATDPKNDDIVKEIVASANQWCAERFVYDQLAHDQLDIWDSYVKLLDAGSPNWQEQWKTKKAELNLGSDSRYKMIQLG